MNDVKKIHEDLLKQIAEGNFDAEEFNKKHGERYVGSNHGKLEVKFVNKSDNADPEYQTDGAAGFDLRANLSKPVQIFNGTYGGNIQIIPTGLYFDLPDNMELQIRPRSGLAAKHGITVLNSPGTLDSDFTGELMVILINHGGKDFIINHGDRIAQGVVSTVTAKRVINLKKVNRIDKVTERGDGKFGSTGIK